ncbi:MAG: hypothetical protein AAF483_03595 [Planctomycetota bacterium]
MHRPWNIAIATSYLLLAASICDPATAQELRQVDAQQFAPTPPATKNSTSEANAQSPPALQDLWNRSPSSNRRRPAAIAAPQIQFEELRPAPETEQSALTEASRVTTTVSRLTKRSTTGFVQSAANIEIERAIEPQIPTGLLSEQFPPLLEAPQVDPADNQPRIHVPIAQPTNTKQLEVERNQPLAPGAPITRVADLPAAIEPVEPMRSEPDPNYAAQPLGPMPAHRPQPVVDAPAVYPSMQAAEPVFQEVSNPTIPAVDEKPLLNVEQMLGPVQDPVNLLSRVEVADDFRSVATPTEARTRSNNLTADWINQNYTWISPVFAHKPLYFEQPNLERYGIGRSRLLQPAISATHFFWTIPLVPYKTLTHHPREKVYTLGRGRPGNCVPVRRGVFLGESKIGEGFRFWQDGSGYR